MNIGQRLLKIYKRLLDYFGTQNWWPGETEEEIIIGAILTQNTNWRNVEKAISNLKNNGVLSIREIDKTDISTIAELIKPSGYFNQKAKKLKKLSSFLMEHYDGDMDKLKSVSTERLRSELLSINGIGAETADSILLYALERPVFVVDAYSFRLAIRHNLIWEDATYEELQELFTQNLPRDSSLYNEYHALIVQLGKSFCKRKNPICSSCPLNFDLH
ncbi:MAG: endonuclease [candidate division Zixibacteria bacterium 4484_93]|nr:MAG: endonuclease [candidate division Zixibacteria bacterium 4484_93]